VSFSVLLHGSSSLFRQICTLRSRASNRHFTLDWFPSYCLLRARGSGLYRRTCSAENPNSNVKMPMLDMLLCHFFRIPLMASTEIAPKKLAACHFFQNPMTKWRQIVKRTPYLYPCKQQHYHGPLCTESTFPTKKMSSCS
jgi:hypothetical protein